MSNLDEVCSHLIYGEDSRDAARRVGFLCPSEVRIVRLRTRDDRFREAWVEYRGFTARGTSKPINGDVDRPVDGERLAIAKAVRNLQAKILKHVGFKRPKETRTVKPDFGKLPGFTMFGVIP